MLPSHRQGLYLLEHCRVMVKDEKLTYVAAEKDWFRFFSIPVANTNVILLGNGTSITSAAARLLSEMNIILGFTGGGGTPLLMASQSGAEYRPSEYCQQWVTLWMDELNRLEMAKIFQERRIAFVEQSYAKHLRLKNRIDEVRQVGERFSSKIDAALGVQELLGYEGEYAKALYRIVSQSLSIDGFTREPGKRDINDPFNSFIDHGNYLAYGLAASALWILGIPFAFPVMHGKTRRGALVFDVADLIKDALIMPAALEAASLAKSDQDSRIACIRSLNETAALTYMIETIQFAIKRCNAVK